MPSICVVGPSVKYFSGISAYTIRLANALSGSNRVSVLLLRDLLPRFLYPGKHNVGRHDYAVNFARGIRTFEGLDWHSPASCVRACRFLDRQKPDAVIMQWWTSAVALPELFLAALNRWKVRGRLILEMHEIIDPLEAGNSITRFYSRVVGRMVMGLADAFVVHSTPVKEQALKIYHLQEDRVFVIRHGVYDNYFKQQPREAARKELGIDGEFVVLYFGMIRKYKGIPCLVEAFNRVPASVAAVSRLVIAGEDWGDEKDLEKMVQDSPYRERITFRPEFVPESAVHAYFSAADVVVLPYTRTSGSGVASLAMAYGKPVIISSLECTEDALQDYPGTVFVPPGDSSAIADRMAEIYEQQKAGQPATYRVPPARTWPIISGQFEEVIGQIKGKN